MIKNMSTQTELAPAASPSEPFPIGDVAAIPATRAVEFLTRIVESESDQLGRARLRWMRDIHYQDWANQPFQEANIAAIEQMATPWDRELLDNGEALVRNHFLRAFRTSIGLLHRTKFMPLDFGDFSTELTEISTYPLSDIAIMVTEIERSMHSHPKVHAVLPELVELYAGLNAISSRDKDILVAVKYGIYLPYTLSSTSRLELHLAKELAALPETDEPIYPHHI